MADNVDKTLPAADDDAVEKKEVALAEQVKQGAQKLIDLHADPAEQEPHSEGVGDDDKDAEIAAILEDLQKAGADLSKVPGLADRLKGLAAAAADEGEDLPAPTAAPAEDEDEPAAEGDEPAEDEDEPAAEGDEPAEDEDEPAAETDEGDMVADGLKACGLDGEDPEVQKAFAAGLKYAKGGKPEEKPAAAQDRAVDVAGGVKSGKLHASESLPALLGGVQLRVKTPGDHRHNPPQRAILRSGGLPDRLCAALSVLKPGGKSLLHLGILSVKPAGLKTVGYHVALITLGGGLVLILCGLITLSGRLVLILCGCGGRILSGCGRLILILDGSGGALKILILISCGGCQPLEPVGESGNL